MSAALGVLEPEAPATNPRTAPPESAHRRVSREDAWPNTKRLLPWSMAAFLVLLCLVPFDSTQLRINTPIDPTLDRAMLVPIGVLWIAALAAGAHRVGSVKLGPPAYALAALLIVGFISIVIALPRLSIDGELTTAVKNFALLLSYAVFYAMVVTIIRPAEVRPFMYLFLGLAAITGLGTIVEYRTGSNPFYSITHSLVSSFASVAPPPAQPRFERSSFVGPTTHGLALVVLVTLALPIAINGMLEYKLTRQRVLLLIAIALLIAGGAATLRRTAGIIPAVAVIALVAIRPRAMVRLAPLGVVLVLAVQIMTPGALASIKGMLFGGKLSEQQSVQGRTEDYDAVAPDVWDKPLFGRGFGSYEPRTYRFIDNQYLVTTLDSGLIGLLAYLSIAIAIVAALWRLARSNDPTRAGPAAAVIAGAAAFFVASALFDILAFPQAPYLLFFTVGLAMVLRSDSAFTRSRRMERAFVSRDEVVPSD